MLAAYEGESGSDEKKIFYASIYYVSLNPGLGPRGSSPSREVQTSLFPVIWGNLGQLLQENPKAFPGQSRNIVPPEYPRSSCGCPSGGRWLEPLTRGASRMHSDQIPELPLLALLGDSTLSPLRISKVPTLSLRESLDTMRSTPLVSTVSLFPSLPRTCDHR